MIISMANARAKLASLYHSLGKDRIDDREFVALCYAKAGDHEEYDIVAYKFDLSLLFKEKTEFRELDSGFLKQIWERLFSKEIRAC